MDLDFFGDKTLSIIIVIILVIVLSAILVPRMLKTVSPIEQGITDEAVVVDNIAEFKKDDFKVPFLLYVQLEVNTKLDRVTKKVEDFMLNKPADVNEPEEYKYIYKYFKLEFVYGDEKKNIPNDYIENLLISFSVSKDWINKERKKKEGDKEIEVKISKNDVRLLVWDDILKKWVKDYPELLNEEKDSYIYQASMPYPYQGLFAIVAK